MRKTEDVQSEQLLETKKEVKYKNDFVSAIETNHLFIINGRDKNVDVDLIVQFLEGHPAIDRVALLYAEIGDIGASALAKISTIKQLSLSSANIGYEGIKALANIMTLERLHLANEQLGKREVEALAKSQSIEILSLCNCLVDSDECAMELAKNTSITYLSLEDNQIGNKGVEALATNRTLKILNLTTNLIGDEGAKALATSDTLQWLSVNDNQIGHEGIIALAKNSSITRLEIAENKEGDEGARALATNKRITTLHVTIDKLGPDGIKILAGSKTIETLALDSDSRDITDDEIRTLMSNTSIRHLNFHYYYGHNHNNRCKISDEGYKMMAANDNLTSVKSLFLTDENKKVFMEANNIRTKHNEGVRKILWCRPTDESDEEPPVTYVNCLNQLILEYYYKPPLMLK